MRGFNKKGLLQTTVLSSLLLASVSAAYAQDDDVETIDETTGAVEESSGDVVVITGSRIRRTDIDTVFPTTVVDSESLDKNAFTNVADALTAIPGFGGGIDPNGNQGANIGANFVDFLDLGVQRTLTLVNGRRFVSSDVSGNSLGVDFNVIPLALVERIETIGVGGAPVYGSDAIAGTINVILKDDFEGLRLTVQGNTTERRDGDGYNIQLVGGANTGDGRGNVTFSAEYFKADGLRQTDRPEIFTNEPFISEVQPGTPGFNDIDVDGDGNPDPVFRQFNRDGSAGQNVQLFTNGRRDLARCAVLAFCWCRFLWR